MLLRASSILSQSAGALTARLDAIEAQLAVLVQDQQPFALRFAKVDAQGEVQSGVGVTSVTHVSTGVYEITFDDLGRTDYSVLAITHGVSSDPNVTITDETATSCRVNIATGDNGSDVDWPIDKMFSILVIAAAQ